MSRLSPSYVFSVIHFHFIGEIRRGFRLRFWSAFNINSLLCNAGFDGGQRQWFRMEIYDLKSGIIQANISSRQASFVVSGLSPGRLLKMAVYAVNARGASDRVLLEGYTLKAAEKQTGKLMFPFFILFSRTDWLWSTLLLIEKHLLNKCSSRAQSYQLSVYYRRCHYAATFHSSSFHGTFHEHEHTFYSALFLYSQV